MVAWGKTRGRGEFGPRALRSCPRTCFGARASVPARLSETAPIAFVRGPMSAPVGTRRATAKSVSYRDLVFLRDANQFAIANWLAFVRHSTMIVARMAPGIHPRQGCVSGT